MGARSRTPASASAAAIPKPIGRLRGRPTKLTRELIDRLADRIAVGAKLVSRAAASVGIHRHTLDEWIQRGKADQARNARSLYAELVDRIDKAQGDLDMLINTRLLEAAGRGDIAALRELRKALPEYAEPQRGDSGIDPQTLALLRRIPQMTDEQLDELVRSGRLVDQADGLPALMASRE